MQTAFLLLIGIISAADALGGTLWAQGAPNQLRGTAMGGSIDRFIYEGSSITAFTFRLSGLRPGSVGPEVGVSLFPQGISAGALSLASDLGGSYSISAPGATLLLKAGGSALTALGSQEVGFTPGLHVGGGLVLRMDNRTGLRLDITRHFYQSGGETDAIWSIGLGFTVLPRPQPPAYSASSRLGSEIASTMRPTS